MTDPDRRVLIFGNSGSGKSTLARALCDRHGLAHLDLDVLAWEPGSPPTRKPLRESAERISEFTQAHKDWVIEGCYADLLELVLADADEVVFLNPGVERCIANCRARPFEPHKYETPEDQHANLEMLCDWVRQYPEREDEFSLVAHQRLFDRFDGRKTEYRDNVDLGRMGR